MWRKTCQLEQLSSLAASIGSFDLAKWPASITIAKMDVPTQFSAKAIVKKASHPSTRNGVRSTPRCANNQTGPPDEGTPAFVSRDLDGGSCCLVPLRDQRVERLVLCTSDQFHAQRVAVKISVFLANCGPGDCQSGHAHCPALQDLAIRSSRIDSKLHIRVCHLSVSCILVTIFSSTRLINGKRI